MKKHASFILVLCALCCGSLCFSQDNKYGSSDHPLVKNQKTPSSDISPAIAKLISLNKSLALATTNLERADINFLIAKYYAAERLKIDSALFYTEKIKQYSLAANYEKGLGKYYLSRAFALYYRGVTDKGIDTAIGIFNRSKDPLFLGYAYRVLGRQHARISSQEVAMQDYHKSIAFLSKAGEDNELQKDYYEMGVDFYKSYETDSAAFYLIASLQLSEKMNEPGRIFSSSGFLGKLYLAEDDIANAAKYLKYAFDVCPPGISKVEVRGNLAYYAEFLMIQHDFEKAERVINEYEKINNQLGDNWGDIILKNIKGIDSYLRSDYPKALEYLRQAYRRVNEILAFKFDIKNIYSYLAKTEFEMGFYDSAILHFSYFRQIAVELKYAPDILLADLLTSQCYEKKNNFDLAYHYFLLYDHAKDSVMTFRKEKTVLELTAKYETVKREQEIQLLRREKEKQDLLNARKSQELVLLSQQNKISRLETSGKTLALENQQKEFIKKQNELALLQKENELQAAIVAQEKQRKNFAYLAIAAVLFFSGYVIYRYLRNRRLSRQLRMSLAELKETQGQLIKAEKEKESENIRVRISRDIHDEVGATLSGVALFSEIVRQKMELHEDKDVQVYLDHITANSKEMIEKMSDIVWTINPQNDSFQRIMDKLRSFAINLCAGKNIRPHFDIDDAVNNYYPSMQVKRNIYLFAKEAINNAVKYSGADNIFLSVKSEEDFITLTIKDDGKGFDKNESREGNGLHNMQARADDFGAEFDIDTQKGRGTSVSLHFSFHPAGGRAALV